MIKKDYFVFLSVLQLILAFAMMPLLLLKHMYGTQAVVIYSITSLLILLGYAGWLWLKGRSGPRTAELGALSFGMIIAFLMAEIVALTVIMIT